MIIKIRYKIISIALLSIFFVIILFASLKNNISEVNTISLKQNSVCVPIIMYHEVKSFKLGKDVISPYEFESDLKYLSKNNYTTITMTQLINYVYNNKDLPKNPIILSFDDGYLNNYVYVLPLLKKYNAKIVFSIIGKNTDDFTQILDDNLDYSHVTWDQLNEMIDSGNVEVQNHTYNLHAVNKGRIGCAQMSGEALSHYEKIMKDDIGKLQEEITVMTGETPNTFTYPYGRSSKNTDAILKELGFQATLSCDYGVNLITKDANGLYGLRRICRSHGQSVEKVLTEAIKTLKYRSTTASNRLRLSPFV